MQQDLGTIVLKNGERVEAAVIAAPDAAWADRLKGFLAHKGELWNWGNAENLTKLTGVETFFYVLHREGVPFSNIMTSEVKGVGHFGHVFTRLEDRRKGACDKFNDAPDGAFSRARRPRAVSRHGIRVSGISHLCLSWIPRDRGRKRLHGVLRHHA